MKGNYSCLLWSSTVNSTTGRLGSHQNGNYSFLLQFECKKKGLQQIRMKYKLLLLMLVKKQDARILNGFRTRRILMLLQNSTSSTVSGSKVFGTSCLSATVQSLDGVDALSRMQAVTWVVLRKLRKVDPYPGDYNLQTEINSWESTGRVCGKTHYLYFKLVIFIILACLYKPKDVNWNVKGRI